MNNIHACLTILFVEQSIGQLLNLENLAPQNNVGGIKFPDSQNGGFTASAKNILTTADDDKQKNDQIEATNFEIKATLSKCLKPKSCDCESTFQCISNDTENLRTGGEVRSKCEKEDDDKILRSCDKKITLTLKIKNRGITNCKPQYIILDHVFDSATGKKQKILNPYVLKITQKPVFQVYDLIFEDVVNSGPLEKVVSKNDDGYSGCSTDPSNPTCGSVQYNNKKVPYSTGFCCSCLSPRDKIGTKDSLNDMTNNIISSNDEIGQSNDQTIVQKDTSNLELPNLNNDPAINGNNIELKVTENNITYLPGDNKIDYGRDGITDEGGKIKENDIPINAQNMIPDNFGSAPRIGRQSSLVKGTKSRNLNQYIMYLDNRIHHLDASEEKVGINHYSWHATLRKRLHKRGGQDCDDTYVPPKANPNTFHDSAHCMEFSDVWYSIYKIDHPNIDHAVDIQIFENIEMKDSSPFWREVTSSGPISVGTVNQRYASDDGTILAYYLVNKQIESEFALDCKIHRLLIPELIENNAKEDQYPEVAGGPSEYLVVTENDIDLSGKTCNKAGVGYEAFVRQPRRCEADRNSCLKNQPKQMWQNDHDLEANGKKGCYFLKNYGHLPRNPVQSKPCNGSSKKTQNKLLFMYYSPCLSSSVHINFEADMNAILRPDAFATITEVYTETLNPKKVTITAKILNSGLVTSIFYVGIGSCPMEMPASFGSITSQAVLIAPQNQHTFTLEVYCELPIKHFYCSLEVFNTKQQLIALRRIRFVRADRCICVWHCECACFLADYGLKCNPLEIEHYHAAGFQGGMPFATQVVTYSAYDDTLSVFLHIILYFCLTLWYMGLLKAMLGCFMLPIGLWGLDKILDLPKKLNRYYENELQDQQVVYDDEGWPIHPANGKKVNNVAPPTQFALNMVFFFIFPFAILWNLCKTMLAPKYSPDEMYSDLDICRCKTSQISLLKDYSLQNTTLKNRDNNQQYQQSEQSEGDSKGEQSKSQSDSDGKKSSRKCMSFRCSKNS